MGTGLEFRILGPFEVVRAGEPVAVHPPRQRAVLVALLLQANRVVSVDRLIELLWGDTPPATARNTVHTLVWRLRRGFADVLFSRPPGYLVRIERDQLDLGHFEILLDRGRDALATGAVRDAAAAFDAALALWRGVPLSDVAGDELRRFALPRLAELQLAAIEGRVDSLLRQGRHVELLAELRGLVAEHPLRESFIGHLMLALYRSGRQAEALEMFRAVRGRLAAELGVEPGSALQRLHRAMLSAEPALDPAAALVPAADVPAARVPAARDWYPPPAQLPADIAAFTGRAAYLRQLDSLLADADADADADARPAGVAGPAAVVVSAIDGTAGLGKTALTIHWAHRVADRFPDGQLYVNLRGFDPTGPVEPAEAMRGFLDALAVPPQRIPTSVDAQAALYRSLLAGRRMLVVLDNAHDADQVRPLLPGASACLVVVTSRNQLTSLVAVEGARPLALGLPSAAEARQMLARRLGTGQVAAEPHAADEIITRCARLPLALGIVAARAAVHPGFPLSALAAQLREAGGGLDALDGGDTASDVRAVFSWSYRAVSVAAGRLFRLLGLHPGPDLAAPAAASLAGLPLARTRPLLAELTRANLVAEPTPGRYAMHDLLRAYAAELARDLDREADRRAALHRLLDHYLLGAQAAALLLDPHRDAANPDPPQPGVTTVDLDSHGDGLGWFLAEHRVLLAALNRAAAGFESHTWRLATALADFLQRQGHWYHLAVAHRAALDAARRLGDRPAQAAAHRGLARAHALLERHDEARGHLRQALDLFGELGDPAGQATTHLSLGGLAAQEGDQGEALRHARRAIRLFRAGGHRSGQGRALNNIGWYHARKGEHTKAIRYCRQALALHREVGDLRGQADTWDSLGYAHLHLDQHADATTCYTHAIQLYRDLGDRFAEADTLSHLGDTQDRAGRVDAARDAWRRAVDILDDLGHPDADEVRTKLKS